MRRVLHSLLFVSLLVGAARGEDPVDFEDPVLRAAVEDKLWVVDPTPTDMLGLTSLTIMNREITSLVGLQYATNLMSLTLQRNNLSDISPLAGLVNLQSLDLEENHISDIGVLSFMPYLSSVNLHRNEIRDISTLANMTSLSWLDLRLNPMNEEAYETHIQRIFDNNPGIWFAYDPTYLRRLQISSTRGGSVAEPGEGVFCYEYRTVVPLAVEAEPGYEFRMWSGSFFSSMDFELLVMEADHAIQANFQSLQNVLYVDDDAPNDPGPGDADRGDWREDGTAEHPFDTIQEAVTVARNGATIVVRPGTYYETIDLLGKSLHITGIDPDDPDAAAYPIVQGGGRGPVLHIQTTYFGDPRCEISGLVVTGGRGAVGALFAADCDLTIRNCLIVGNQGTGPDEAVIHCKNGKVTFDNCTIADNCGRDKGAAIVAVGSDVTVANSIVFGNTPQQILADEDCTVSVRYSNIAGGWPGSGNIDEDPLFVRRGHWATRTAPEVEIAPTYPGAVWMAGDYHLKSQAGRWDSNAQAWTPDAVTSPCIDRGDPEAPVGREPAPNAGVINMGAYGGTTEASKSY